MKFKFYWKICNFEVRIYYYVIVRDWVFNVMNDVFWFYIYFIISLYKGSVLMFLLLVDE